MACDGHGRQGHLQPVEKCLTQILEIGRGAIKKHLQFGSGDTFDDKPVIFGSGKTCSALSTTGSPGEGR